MGTQSELQKYVMKFTSPQRRLINEMYTKELVLTAIFEDEWDAEGFVDHLGGMDGGTTSADLLGVAAAHRNGPYPHWVVYVRFQSEVLAQRAKSDPRFLRLVKLFNGQMGSA